MSVYTFRQHDNSAMQYSVVPFVRQYFDEVSALDECLGQRALLFQTLGLVHVYKRMLPKFTLCDSLLLSLSIERSFCRLLNVLYAREINHEFVMEIGRHGHELQFESKLKYSREAGFSILPNSNLLTQCMEIRIVFLRSIQAAEEQRSKCFRELTRQNIRPLVD